MKQHESEERREGDGCYDATCCENGLCFMCCEWGEKKTIRGSVVLYLCFLLMAVLQTTSDD